MKLLITADLHFRLPWFRWLIQQAPDFDLVCVAGDLLDMFKASESAVSFVSLWATASFSGLNRSHLGSTCLSNAGRARKKTTETERMEESLQQAFGLITRLTHEQGRSRHPEG
jgi:Icc-related predicted phosphoesterase